MDFDKKVVLVTGASVGIGEAIAEEFARHGASLALVGRNQQGLETVAERCSKILGRQALAIVADLGTDSGCEKVVQETLKKFGRVDVLVNNAGVGCLTTIQTDPDMKNFDYVFSVNVRGVYNLTRLLVPTLIETKGNIVNISSVASLMVHVGALPYAMSKAALDHFTRLIAVELAPKGVRVNTVSPGLTVSTFQTRITGMSQDAYRDFLGAAGQQIPLGRVCQGSDIARMAVHVASDASALVTGAIIPVDGGMRLSPGGGPGRSSLLKILKEKTDS